MADTNQRLLAKVMTDRNTQELAHPTQQSDSTTILTADVVTFRAANSNTDSLAVIAAAV